MLWPKYLGLAKQALILHSLVKSCRVKYSYTVPWHLELVNVLDKHVATILVSTKYWKNLILSSDSLSDSWSLFMSREMYVHI